MMKTTLFTLNFQTDDGYSVNVDISKSKYKVAFESLH